MFSLILIIIIAGCLAALGVIFFSKIPKVTVINTQAAPVVQQLNIKKRLLEERFERRFKTAFKKLAVFLKPFGQWLLKRAQLIYQKVAEKEAEYRQRFLKAGFKSAGELGNYLKQKLAEAEALAAQENYLEAEKLYIEILTLDDKNAAAYKGLGDLYLQQKDFEHARETFEFLLKLKSDEPFVYRKLGTIASEKGDLKAAQEDYLKSLALDAGNVNTYLELAKVYLNLEEKPKAFDLLKEAAGLEPNNPKVLDFLIEVSIIMRDKETALKTFWKLREVNPENQKLSELKEQIEKL